MTAWLGSHKSLSLCHTSDHLRISREMRKGLSTEWRLITSAGQELGITNRHQDRLPQAGSEHFYPLRFADCTHVRVQTHTHLGGGNGSYKGGRLLRHTWFIDSHCTSPAAEGFLKTGICLEAAWASCTIMPHCCCLHPQVLICRLGKCEAKVSKKQLSVLIAHF